MKYCSFCNAQHTLSSDFWYSVDTKPRCKVRVLAKQKEYTSINRASRLEYAANYRKTNVESLRAKDRIRNATATRKESKREYRRSDKSRATSREWLRAKLNSDLNFLLSIRLRVRLCAAIRNGQKKGSAVRDLGCTIPELRSHLESKFVKGMSWETYGRDGWHIDHIRPLSSFDLTDPKQLQQAVHFTNLQPLWAVDNLRKSDKYSA